MGKNLRNLRSFFARAFVRNGTDLLQVVKFTGSNVAICQQVATNLSISSSCNKSVKIRLVATCHFQTCYNLLKQLVASLWITSLN